MVVGGPSRASRPAPAVEVPEAQLAGPFHGVDAPTTFTASGDLDLESQARAVEAALRQFVPDLLYPEALGNAFAPRDRVLRLIPGGAQ
jgi:hypothetical protein